MFLERNMFQSTLKHSYFNNLFYVSTQNVCVHLVHASVDERFVVDEIEWLKWIGWQQEMDG